MSLRIAAAIALLTVAGSPRPAAAQFVRDGEGETGQRDDDGDGEGGRASETDVDARVVTTAFVHHETGDAGDPLDDNAVAPDNASPFNRFFVDLRLALNAKHIAGGRWASKADVRVRAAQDERVQSGALSGDEYDLRELTVSRGGDHAGFALGRMTVGEIAATKIDGLRLDLKVSKRVRALAFAGAYPRRGSRSLDTDYPRARSTGGDEVGDRVIPFAGGAGVAYGAQKLHGSVGFAGIAPLVDNPETGSPDEPRLFFSANGYWLPSRYLSVYHYAVLDVAGEAGAGLTNLSVGVDGRPFRGVRLRLAVHHIDTELLAITAQDQLEDPDQNAMGIVQNNIAVQRISSDAARGGLSVALARQRFELSVSGALRRRPEVTVPLGDGGEFVFPETKAADVTLSILDRRSVGGLRLGASVTLVTGLGDTQPTRSDSRIARLYASHTLAGGAGEWELDVGYLQGDDGSAGMTCTGLDPLGCYGTSRVRAIQGGTLVAYPIAHRTLVIADVHLGAEDVTATGAMGEDIDQPTRFVTTGFFRVQRRF